MKFVKLLVALSAMLTLTSCATIFSGSSQAVNIRVISKENHQLIKNARCTVVDGQGLYHVVQGNPGRVHLSKGKGGLTVTCEKKGYEQASTGAGESFNGLTLINVLFWPGFIVDAATGSTQKYPSHVTVIMEEVVPEKKATATGSMQKNPGHVTVIMEQNVSKKKAAVKKSTKKNPGHVTVIMEQAAPEKEAKDDEEDEYNEEDNDGDDE